MKNSESQQLTKNSSEERLSASSSSSFSSLSADLISYDSPLSPATILQFQGVPFSWEKLPGIPKSHETQQTRRKRETLTLLPLPPPPPTASLNRFSTTDLNSKNSKKSAAQSEKDPFLAAFVECCRDEYNDHHQNSKNMKKMPPPTPTTTSTNHRFGFFSLYAICSKTSGPVAESLVYIPKSSNSLF